MSSTTATAPPHTTTPPARSKRPPNGRRRRSTTSMEAAILSRYHIINRIGAGSMGTVFQVTDRTTFRLHALKVVCKGDATDTLSTLSMRREASALRRFKHPNIVRFHHAHQDAHYIFVATEYCSQGDLLALLRRTSIGLPEHRALSIMKQVFLALAYLHARGASHRDVKLQNILLAVDGSVRLADLGLVHCGRNHETQATHPISRRVCGTREYAAPEIFAHDGYVPQFADMWACGITLCMLLTRRTPFAGLQWEHEDGVHAVSQNVRSLLDGDSLAHVSTTCRSLLRGLLAADAHRRLSAKKAAALCDLGLRDHSLPADKALALLLPDAPPSRKLRAQREPR